MNDIGTVFVVDDDEAVRKSLVWLLRSLGMTAEAFSSAQEFLDQYDSRVPGCLVLDVRMPGMSGLELQEKLAEKVCCLPVIFISGHGDIPMAVRAMKCGAYEFLQKPFSDQVLLDHINKALELARRQYWEYTRRASLQERLGALTEREKEVMALLIEGRTAKEIARELDLSPRTIETHRINILEKMRVGNAVELTALVTEYHTHP